ncbi:hypothetical protein BU120_11735 [Staphylococcus xylosus]|nr:hypothetical protein BU120_11735 [Staphylococcus xylosus]
MYQSSCYNYTNFIRRKNMGIFSIFVISTVHYQPNKK